MALSKATESSSLLRSIELENWSPERQDSSIGSWDPEAENGSNVVCVKCQGLDHLLMRIGFGDTQEPTTWDVANYTGTRRDQVAIGPDHKKTKQRHVHWQIMTCSYLKTKH